ncbi:AAA ATPase, partial [Reticulomyxa filosa]
NDNGNGDVEKEEELEYDNKKETATTTQKKMDIADSYGTSSKGENKMSGKMDGYSDDLEYLQEFFKVIELRILIYMSSLEETDSSKFMKKTQKTTLRELKNKEKQAYKKCMARLQATIGESHLNSNSNSNSNSNLNASNSNTNRWCPRMEQLVQNRQLQDFERWIVLTLVGCILSVDILKAAQRQQEPFTVGEMLAIHCEDLRSQIACRKYFYKSARLVKEDIMHVQAPEFVYNSDLMHYQVEIDRRMVDYIVGLDSEFGSLVQGSGLYSPTVRLDEVVLAQPKKDLIVNTISSMEELRRTLQRLQTGQGNAQAQTQEGAVARNAVASDYGKGTVVLFFGMSGTGKNHDGTCYCQFLPAQAASLEFPCFAKGRYR